MFAAWLALDVGKRFGIECEHWEKQVRKKGWRRGRHQAGEGRLISRWHWIWQRVETSCIEQGALISTWIDISSVMETSPFQSFTLSASTPFLIFSPICLFLYSPLLLSFPLFLSRFLSFSLFFFLSLSFSLFLSFPIHSWKVDEKEDRGGNPSVRSFRVGSATRLLQRQTYTKWM